MLAISELKKMIFEKAGWLISQAIPNPIVEPWERQHLTNPGTPGFRCFLRRTFCPTSPWLMKHRIGDMVQYRFPKKTARDNVTFMPIA